MRVPHGSVHDKKASTPWVPAADVLAHTDLDLGVVGSSIGKRVLRLMHGMPTLD